MTTDPCALDTPLPGRRAAPRASRRFIALYGLATFGFWMTVMTPVIVTMALKVNQLAPDSKETTLAWVLGIGAFVAMIANPVAGLFSDRTRSRFGMRRPWLAGGALLGLAGLAIVAASPSVWLLMLGWSLAQLAYNAVLAALMALMPDQIHESQRGAVGGLLGMCMPAGILAGVYVAQEAGSLAQMFLLPAGLFTVFVFLLCACMRDRMAPAQAAQALSLSGFARSFMISPRGARDFLWAFASRFLLLLGIATLMTYQVFYMLDKLGVSTQDVPDMMFRSTLVSSVAIVLSSLASGWLSDRSGRRKAFVLIAALIYAAGLLVIGMAHDFTGLLWGVGVCGLGQGMYVAVDLALVTEVLPNPDEAAKDLGLFNLASAMPQSVAPMIAPLFLALGGPQNYGSLFTAAAAFAGLGALAVLPIRKVR